MQRRFGSFFYTQKPKGREDMPRRWNIFAMLGKIIRRTCMALGALMLFSLLLTIGLGVFIGTETKPSLPDDMILVYNITDGVSETHMMPSLTDPFAMPSMTVHDVIKALDVAATDARVRGLLVSLDSAAIELTQIQELRTAVARFRASGKFAHIYSASFADLGSGIGAYYFASAFDQIWMQPVGFLSITGLAIEMPFARGLLEKVGVRAEFLHREEYKSAMESFTNDSMSPANRESMQSILDDMSATMTKDILDSRKISKSNWDSYMNRGLLTGKEALKDKLITRLDYADVLLSSVRKDATGQDDDENPPLVLLEDYFDAAASKHNHGKKSSVAMVTIAGEIVPGDEFEPGYATGDYIASAIFEAAKSDDIKVIVVRVDSPGGSPTASETIRRSIVYAKQKGKKVIVSMGSVAASGGYWVATDADKIYALPSTLTGSIGVIMGKFELGGLFEKLGVTWDGMSWGENAGLWSMSRPMKESERAALNAAIDDTYDAFLTRVAQGRKMDKAKVREIAKGRAWTGNQAVKNGLVDEIGGLDAALDDAAKSVGEKDRMALNVTILPKPKTALEQVMMMMGQGVSMGNTGFTGALFDLFHQARVVERGGVTQTYAPALKEIR